LANKRSLVDRINALPKWARDYIMQIETESDPAGTQRRLIEQQDLIRELTAEVAELKGEPFNESELDLRGRACTCRGDFPGVLAALTDSLTCGRPTNWLPRMLTNTHKGAK
jgi:hypothetical protein